MKRVRFVSVALAGFFITAIALVLLAFSPFNPFAPNVQDLPPTQAVGAIHGLTPRSASTTAPGRGMTAAAAVNSTPTTVPDAPGITDNPSPTQPDTPSPDQPVNPTAAPTDTSADAPDLPPPTLPAGAPEAFQQGLVLRRNGDYVRAATAFRTVVQDAAANNSDPALARQAQFRLGESLYLATDFTNAVPALQAVVQANDADPFAARAHYLLGDIFTQQQKYDGALEELRTYRRRTRALMGVIDREIGDVLFASGDSAAAIQQYDAALKDPTLNPDQRVALLKKIAEVYTARAEPQLAAGRLEQAFKLAPDNPTRADVEFLWGQALADAGDQAQAITHWKHALAAYTETAGAHSAVAKLVDLGVAGVDELQRGIANYAVGNYDLAIQAFRRSIAATNTSSADLLYYAGMAYLKKGDEAGALRNLGALLQAYPQDKRAADALYAQALAQMRQGNPATALATLRQLLKKHPNDVRVDDGFWSAALTYEGAGDYAHAAAAYAELATTLPNSGYAPSALFNAGMSSYLAQNPGKAQAYWNSAIKTYPQSQFADSAAYWLGKLAQEQGDLQAATQFFQQATQPPRTYYSWRAFDALNQPAPPPSYDLADYAMDDSPASRAELASWVAAWSKSASTPDLPAAVLADPFFQRGSEYASLARALDARSQFQAVNERFAEKPAALLALAFYYKDNNFFGLSIDAAGRLSALSGQPETAQPRLLRQLIYPTYYADLIVPYAQRHSFDPALFFGLVRQESSFNPLSYSSADARGLTQVIPGTADLIARALNLPGFVQNDLFKPYVSVRFGSYYFGNVLETFDGNIFYGLIGYNGGPGNVRRWQKPDLDTMIESIPYAETYLYVRTVYDQYREYVDVYRGKGN